MTVDIPIPENEAERLQALRSYRILDTVPEQAYDDITRLASYICQAPIALITLIDEDREFAKAKIGMEHNGSARADSFCRYTIMDNTLMEVPDTLTDPKFSDHDAVTGELGIRFYAGAPLIDNDGHRLGALCVIDNKPRTLSAEQRDALQILAREVISHLTIRKQKMALEETVVRHTEFFNLFNNSPDIHCIIDADANIELINDAVKPILGYEPHEAIGMPVWKFFNSHIDLNKLQQLIDDPIKYPSTEIESEIASRQGDIRWVCWSVSIKNGKWYTSGRDITYQKKLTAELEELSLVANKITNGVAIMDANDHSMWVNPAFTNITGYNLKEVRGKQLADVLRGDYDDPNIRQKIAEGMRNKQAFKIQLQVFTKDGKQIWLSVANNIILDDDGNIQKIIKVITDITARKHAEHDRNILTFAVQKSTSGFLVRDKDAKVTWMNDAFEQMLGYSLDDIKGKAFGSLLLGEETDMSVFEQAVEQHRQKRSYEIEIKVYKKDRTPIWVYLSNSPLLNADGEVERQVSVVVDITARKAAEQQMAMLSLVASNTTSGVVINDSQGKVEWVNNAFTTVTGYDITDVKDRHLGDVIKGEMTDVSIIQKARELSKNKQSFEVDLLVYRKDGQPLWISVINSVIVGGNGKVEKYIEVVIDITAKKKIELELIAAKEEALQLGRAKEMFMSVMSHEIRTPLNAVIGISNLLLKDELLPAQKGNLDVLKFSADNLMSLINDVLDFTKIETGNVELEKAPVNIRSIIQGVSSTIQFKANEKNIFVKQDVDHTIPDVIIGDSARLVQILLNLAGNAVKFTEKGGVTISLSVVEQTQTKVRIRFGVTDTGIGIAHDKINTIFEQWKQADADTTRKYGGTGLGLAISKRLVTLHGSRINVDSVPGQGSTFWFTISFKKGTEPTTSKNIKVEETLKLHALVVDDNQINRLLLSKVLKKWGATADFAEDGLQAVQMIQDNQNYDVVLMDIHMPEMGGLEATEVVRSNPGSYFQQLPIVALTASMLTDQMDEISNAGMNDYVMKPFDPKALFEKLSLYQKQ
ncbi:PAS domain S-box protein [Mucilaginibacter myungsuensis]|uniref:histidine kinase n=1 Tax=Mucilaginibacter myungsuensis TaxID=649104 RepID=A0A929PZ40_9SPHI|nr:PAS domain S-box protein [Mucilaginibacter myungsuensis]MBE9663997.1 PAS domain S-box protein [Mucilaginibacter myungsuensis]MDN3601176.1 PAS domain S-box protein [Mucilaginibacter myungsuensis]